MPPIPTVATVAVTGEGGATRCSMRGNSEGGWTWAAEVDVASIEPEPRLRGCLLGNVESGDPSLNALIESVVLSLLEENEAPGRPPAASSSSPP